MRSKMRGMGSVARRAQVSTRMQRQSHAFCRSLYTVHALWNPHAGMCKWYLRRAQSIPPFMGPHLLSACKADARPFRAPRPCPDANPIASPTARPQAKTEKQANVERSGAIIPLATEGRRTHTLHAYPFVCLLVSTTLLPLACALRRPLPLRL